MAALYFVPPRGPFIDPRTGELTRTAVMFLKQLFERVGGSAGDGTLDLSAAQFEDAGIEETKAMVMRFADDSAVMPPVVLPLPSDDDPSQRIAALEATVAELRKELDALRVGTIVI